MGESASPSTPDPASHPCLRCGACCAHFRVSFYWAEADDATPGGVPAALTAPLTPHLRVMRGTSQPAPRCIALKGEIGKAVACNIHPQRSSVCRDFTPAWEDGSPNPHCDAARARWGLPPLTLADWTPQIHVPLEVQATVATNPAVDYQYLGGSGSEAPQALQAPVLL